MGESGTNSFKRMRWKSDKKKVNLFQTANWKWLYFRLEIAPIIAKKGDARHARLITD